MGIDLLAVDSICSFSCVYCQLGKINITTSERSIFVPTACVMDDLSASDWDEADVVTFSGSGEPTLALNLGEVIHLAKVFTDKPVVVLTNATLLDSPQVRRELCLADSVFCKLDAWNDGMMKRINRPVPGVTLKGIVDGISLLRREFAGKLAVQTMVIKEMDETDMKDYAGILNKILPDEVQLNLPSRPVPASFAIRHRENVAEASPGSHVLKTIDREALLSIRDRLEPIVACEVLCK